MLSQGTQVNAKSNTMSTNVKLLMIKSPLQCFKMRNSPKDENIRQGGQVNAKENRMIQELEHNCKTSNGSTLTEMQHLKMLLII